MTETDHKPYTDADVETAVKAMWRVGAPCDGSFTRAEVARIVLDALTAAGWQPAAEADRLRTEHQLLRRHLTTLADRMTARANHTTAPVDGFAMRDFADSIRALINHQANTATCPCGPGAPVHLHGIGGYAQPDWSHEIAFDTDGTWSIGHPDGCPGQAFGDCDVARLAGKQIGGTRLVDAFALDLAGHRFRCAVNDLHDRFLLGDRIDCTCPMADVSTLGDPPDRRRTARGLDPRCPQHGRTEG